MSRCFGGLFLSFFIVCSFPAYTQTSTKPPNIVLLLVDDLGWRDTEPYGNTHIDTPRISQLAKQGMRYTTAYANAPVCSPSRVSILTGKNPARAQYSGHITAIGRHRYPDNSAIIPPADRMDIPLRDQTLAELLKPAGYVSASIGKWHVGREGFWPHDQGFDINIGGWTHGSPPHYFHPYTDPNKDWNPNIPYLSGGKEGDYLTDHLTDEAIAFMKTNREKPFFLYLTHYGVHTPLQAPQQLIDKYTKRFAGKKTGIDPAYAAMVENMDMNTGRVLDAIKSMGLEDNTLFIFYSDNGGAGSATNNRPLRGDKGHLYEGGIRVPLIIKWPGRIDENSSCNTPVIGSDLFATIAEVAKQTPQDTIDGLSLRNSWSGGIGPDRDTLYWYYPHYLGVSMRPGAAIRKDNLKLMEYYDPMSVELYDLENDPYEKNNIAQKKPNEVETLQAQLHEYLKSVNTIMHTPNPNKR